MDTYDYDSLVSKFEQIKCSNTFVDSKTSIFAKLYFNKSNQMRTDQNNTFLILSQRELSI